MLVLTYFCLIAPGYRPSQYKRVRMGEILRCLIDPGTENTSWNLTVSIK